ncbi:sterol carrier family protein [Auraticoccus monumenti]|uniref:TIGR03083 family protein n=1 Tax=Auraticoccus monumenti TaxID=675864 RepID=A0A1G7DYW1_9ACTN|nr:sterol carrier family protein [Auraticoccus monumenti]SDE56440.1 TIGR03083 family protein [Auraticoccus monumenti]
MPPPRPRPRVDLELVAELLRTWADWLPSADPSTPTPLPGWDVGTLSAHLVVVGEGLLDGLGRPTRDAPLPVLDYVARYAAGAGEIDERARARADGPTAADLAELAARISEAAAGAVPAVVAGPRGPLRGTDWVATRLVDAVVHADDLTRAVPGAPGPSRKAEAAAVRHLLAWLTAEHPGQTLEVRVPPHGAVQCGVEGSTLAHTRGTPPNVVECAPRTFLRLATGRLAWLEARSQGLVSASGHRADLSGWLPLLR